MDAASISRELILQRSFSRTVFEQTLDALDELRRSTVHTTELAQIPGGAGKQVMTALFSSDGRVAMAGRYKHDINPHSLCGEKVAVKLGLDNGMAFFPAGIVYLPDHECETFESRCKFVSCGACLDDLCRVRDPRLGSNMLLLYVTATRKVRMAFHSELQPYPFSGPYSSELPSWTPRHNKDDWDNFCLGTLV